MQKTLDLSIKTHETGTTEGGFIVKDGKAYASYMSNSAWNAFIGDMEENYPQAFGQYGAGSGGECKSNGVYPPKMASYGSSSRMIYNLCKDIPGFRFEYKLPTTVGGIANLDGYLEKENERIYVEAKCREPYGEKPHLIEKKYEELYRFLNEQPTNNLNISISEGTASKIKTLFSVDGKEIRHFDMKQMICHLLGIATKHLQEPISKRITFLYLVCDPTQIKLIHSKKGERIIETYNAMCAECNAVDFKALFEDICRFLDKKLNLSNTNISAMINSFSFRLQNQSDFLNEEHNDCGKEQ